MTRSARWCGAAVLAAVLCCTAHAAADEPVRPSERDSYGEYPPSGTRATLVIAGLATSAVWYGLGVGASYAWPDAPGASDLRIPIAGPWMALPETECFDADDDCSVVFKILRIVMLGIDGVGQAGGLAVAAEGLFLPTSSGEAIGKRQQARKAPRILAAPSSLGRSGAGVVVFGHF